MDDKEIIDYVMRCISELASQFKEDNLRKDDHSYGNYEADFHFDLYFLLNHLDSERFWKNKAVQATIPNEEDNKKFDLIVYDPDSLSRQPKIAIEIKVKYRESEVAKDFRKLMESTISQNNLVDRIFLYFGDGDKNDLLKVKAVLKKQIVKYPKISCMLIHLASDKLILYNEDIIKE